MITNCKYKSYEPISGTTFRVTCELTDSVLGIYRDGFVASGLTQSELRDSISKQIVDRNVAQSLKVLLDGVAVDTNIPVTYTPPTPPAPTATQVWLDKVRRLNVMIAGGTYTGTVATAITALKTDIQNTYVSGYIDSV